jgi:YD repeat-containing protein
MSRLIVRSLAIAVLLAVTVPAWSAVGRTPGSFDVSQSGTAQYVIPLWSPPGTHGMNPSLSLSYNHNGGNGIVGVGWSVGGVSLITRCTSTFAQDGMPRDIRNDYSDRFCLDGNRLRLTSGAYGNSGSTYQTEIETFSRVTSFGAAGNGPQSFTVERKDGLIYEYGNTADSRIESVGQSTAWAWALNKIRDRSGNAILFNYTEDTTNGAFRLESVQYTSNPNQGLSPAYEVDFVYVSKPSNEIDSQYIAGSVIKQIMRLVRVDVTYNGNLVRQYQLTYESALSSTSRSRLQSVQECAGSPLDCYPATTFTYQNGTSGLAAQTSSGASVPAGVAPLPVDVNGDGRADLVYSSSTTSGAGTWMVMLASTSGGYGSPINSGVTNTNFSGAIPIDYNSDGNADLLVPYSGGTWWVMLGGSSGLSAPSNTGAPATATGTGRNARAADINGDGRDDLVWADLVGYAGGDAIRYRLRDPSGAFSSTVTTLVGPMPVDSMIVNNVFDPVVQRLAKRASDFNGDGRGDLSYHISSREWDAEAGRYFFAHGMEVICSGGWTFSGGVNGNSFYYGDFNGDGKTDLVHFSAGTSFNLVFSRGTSLAPTLGGPSVAGYGRVALLDWDGDGFDDLLALHGATSHWHLFRSNGEFLEAAVDTGLTAPAIADMAVADLDGDGLDDLAYNSGGTWYYRTHAGVAPDLLKSATDGFGNSVTFNYAALTQGVHIKSTGAAFPEQEYQAPLYVVSNYVASNGVGGSYTITYSYAGARMHRQGRGFEGFYQRITQDSRNNLYRYDYFNRLFPLTGSTFQSDLVQPNNVTLISRTENTWTAHSYGSGFDTRSFPYISNSTTRRYEAGGAFNGSLISTAATSNTVNSATGTTSDTTTTITEASTANGVQSGQVYSQRTYLPTLFNDFTNWCIGRSSSSQQIYSHTGFGGGSQTRQTDTTWDGLACRPTQVVEQPGDSMWQVTTGIGYDNFGNVNSQSITGIGMAARTTTTNWGSSGQFPVSVTNPLSQTSQMGWNYSLGTQSSQTDPNGITISWQHDGFGRKTRENRADGTYSIWTPYLCSSGAGVCYYGDSTFYRINRYDYGTDNNWIRWQLSFFDQMDRPTGSAYDNVTGAQVDQRIIYDALGRIASQSQPFFISGGTQYFTTFTYDLLNRVTQQSRPVSDSDPSQQTITTYYEGLTSRVIDPQTRLMTKTATVLGQLARTSDHDNYGQTFSYDAFGNVVRIQDSAGNTLQTNSYNIRGVRIGSTDIDRGSWTYTPNALGEYVSQIDANSKTTSFTYDALSRPLTKSEPDGAGTVLYTYTYGVSAAAKNIGKLEWIQIGGTSVLDNRQTFTYDSVGRLGQTKYSELGAGIDYFFDQSYNSITGLLETLTYPTSTSSYRLKLKYEYQNGILNRISDFNAPTTVFWHANAADPYGHVTDEDLGNGLRTARSFDAVTGWVDSIQTGPGGGTTIQNLGYLFDKVGNLIQRQDNRQALTENFYYDNLYRLDYSTLNGVTNLDLTYNALGNITNKTGIGAYVYHPSKIHAVQTLGGDPSYQYDGNGNGTGEPGDFTFSYYTSNAPKQANWLSGGYSSTFQLGPDGQRFHSRSRRIRAVAMPSRTLAAWLKRKFPLQRPLGSTTSSRHPAAQRCMSERAVERLRSPPTTSRAITSAALIRLRTVRVRWRFAFLTTHTACAAKKQVGLARFRMPIGRRSTRSPTAASPIMRCSMISM